MATILAGTIGRDRYRTTLKTPVHTFIGDEPADEGGTDLGPSPYEYLLAALATCTCATLRMYADRKGLALEMVDVDLSLEVDRSGPEQVTRISRKIVLQGELSGEERIRLLQIAAKCPVHRMLTNKFELVSELV